MQYFKSYFCLKASGGFALPPGPPLGAFCGPQAPAFQLTFPFLIPMPGMFVCMYVNKCVSIHTILRSYGYNKHKQVNNKSFTQKGIIPSSQEFQTNKLAHMKSQYIDVTSGVTWQNRFNCRRMQAVAERTPRVSGQREPHRVNQYS